jgi:hypothetical protein
MISKIVTVIQSLVLFAVMTVGCYATYQGYKIYLDIRDRVEQMGQWIDRFAMQEKRWLRHVEDSEIRMLELKDNLEKLNEVKQPENKPVQELNKPTVLMFGSESCGPCRQWWSENAKAWMDRGWIVEKRIDESGRAIPYWRVYDGSKWIEINSRLTFDSYRQAGGR